MNSRARVALWLVLAVLLPHPVLAQLPNKTDPRTPPPRRPDNNGAPQYESRTTGEAEVGEPAPDFELDASNGKPLRLSDRRGHWVLLAFGDRKETVARLRSVAAALDSSGITVLGVCNEKAYFLEAYAKQEKFPFLLLADVTREVSDMYGLYESRERFVLPGFIMIGPRGVVRFALIGESLPPQDVLRLAQIVSARP